MKNPDMRKYGTLMNKLQLNFAMGHDDYAKMFWTAINQLSAHKHNNYGKKKKQTQ